MAKSLSIVKYTFFVVIVFSAGLAIERLQGIKRWWKADPLTADDLSYNDSTPLAYGNFDSVLNKHYLKCVTQPSKPFCLLSANKRLEIFRNEEGNSPNVEEIENRLQNITSSLEPRKRRIHSLLISFTRLMKENQIKVLLVEPSMLFCLLSTTKKFDMLAKGFNPGRLKGSRNIVTVGVLSEDSEKMETKNFTNQALSAGFSIKKFRKWVTKESEKSFETVHYFFILQDVAIHVVTFYPRDSYMWHSGLDPKETDFEGLLFVNEGIFEYFTHLPLDLSRTSINQIFIPYDIRYFMTEMDSSRVVKCRTNSSDTVSLVTHPYLTKEQLYKRVVITLKELKTILAPQLAHFWLWSKSLLGWFIKCDIFYYSTTLDLALTFRSIQDLNLTEALEENEYLKFSNFNKSESDLNYRIDCHGLLVNLFIIYEDEGVFWYRQSKDLDKLTYPVFPLCSSQIAVQKILVPCNTEDIVKLENGQHKTYQASLSVPSKNNLILSNESGS